MFFSQLYRSNKSNFITSKDEYPGSFEYYFMFPGHIILLLFSHR
jgi:hypothetical protein